MLNAPGIGTHQQVCLWIKRGYLRGWPGGVAVKFTCSASLAEGSPVQILGADLALLIKPCCGRHPTYMYRKMGTDVKLRANLPEQKEEDWQQMLAQG